VERAVTDVFDEPDNATPLTHEEKNGLLQSWINSRQELNEAEQANIAKAAAWARRRRNLDARRLLTEDFVKALHKQMLGEVWSWAGAYRRSERNIGIEAHRITTDMPMMFDDVGYWIANAVYSSDEIAVRLHHRLIAIHPFANGNGRHARLMADLLVERLNGTAFSWGAGTISGVGELRARYIAGLRSADDHDLGPLLAFARS
jgi:Fic-DOC domain mobile mystery protein B